MNEKQLRRALDSVGKGSFVKHVSLFADATVSNADAVDYLMKTEGYTRKSGTTKVYNARRILHKDAARAAMTIIVDSATMERAYPIEWRAAKDWLASR